MEAPTTSPPIVPPSDRPRFSWKVPDERLHAAQKDDMIASEEFQLAGLTGNFELHFWPKGHRKAGPGKSSLFLASAADVKLQAELHVNDKVGILEPGGLVSIKGGSDRGWFDFGSAVDKNVSIGIVLLQHGSEAEWPIPAHLKPGRLLGSGSYGCVREAWDSNRQCKVAVKQIQGVFSVAADAKRILREIAILRETKHPNVVAIFDVIEPPDTRSCSELYMCMELCDTDLSKICKTSRGVSLPESRRLAYTLCLGINYLHSVGVYHRDLKPANCLANRDCTVKICDFNLSRTVAQDDDDDDWSVPPAPVLQRTLTELVCTRWYRSPEVILSLGYTEAMDVWSVGCILVEVFRVLNTGGRLPTSSPLFTGRRSWPLTGDQEEGDQLDRIFDVLGSPFEDEQFGELPGPRQDQLRRYDGRPGSGLRAAVPVDASEAGLDLVAQMLQFFPSRRISMDKAVKHEFFGKVKRSTHEDENPDRQQLDLGFEDSQISSSREVQQEMRRKVDRFRQDSAT